MQFVQPHHEMQMMDVDTSGAEEWYCPSCYRQVMVSWFPDFKRVVLEPGDETAIHGGSHGGLTLSFPQVSPSD